MNKNLKHLVTGTLAAIAVFGASGTAFAANHSCTVNYVGAAGNRVHVRCTAAKADGSAQVFWFAVANTDSTLANRLLSLGTTAIVSGRPLSIDFTAGDTSGASFGCQSNDCRKATGVALVR